MKKALNLLILAVVIFVGYSSCTAKTTDNKTEKPAATVSQDEEHVAIKMNKAMFLEKVWDYENSPKEWKYKGDKPAIIDFYADWCGPCRMAAPVLEEVAKEYKDKIVVYKVNTQYEKELATVFGIRSIPAFLYIPTSGKPTMAAGTGRTTEDTKNLFEKMVKEILLKE